MRHTVLAVMLACCLVPMAAHAAPAPAPCDLLDQQMLTALNLADAATKVEHKAIAATAQAPANRMDMCTFTPRVGTGASLSVMRLPLAKKMPGLRKFQVSRGPVVSPAGQSPCAAVQPPRLPRAHFSARDDLFRVDVRNVGKQVITCGVVGAVRARGRVRRRWRPGTGYASPRRPAGRTGRRRRAVTRASRARPPGRARGRRSGRSARSSTAGGRW